MINYLSGIKSEKMHQYLNQKQDCFFKQNHFYCKILEIQTKEDYKKILDFLEEIVGDAIFIEIDSNIIMFYFEDIDVNFKEIFSWISDDFGINLKVFSSCKINSQHPEYFQIIYKYYTKYLKNKPFSYYTIKELILEIIKIDLEDLKPIKPVILNNVYHDSQLEKLINSMFDNNLNVTKTSMDIYMHRNTVINKLDYIKSETSLNIQNFTDALCMYWLIKIK